MGYKYLKLAEKIEELIVGQMFLPGEKLPKVRELARQEVCSVGTVVKAYDYLSKRRIIFQKKHSGYYVSEDFFQLGNHRAQDGYYLDSGNTINELLHQLELFTHVASAGELYRKISRNTPMKGNDSLINCLVKVLEQQGIYAKSEDIYLCLGTLHGLTILTQIAFQNDKQCILIEEPTFSYFVEYLKTNELEVKTIKRHTNGIDLVELEELFKNGDIKFFYVVPRNHNPYGTYLSYYERKGIVRLAKIYQVYIIEDDYLSGYDGLKKYNPLFYYDKEDMVIYLQSFSKVLPMLRIGLIILPKELRSNYEEEIVRNAYTTYYTPSLLSQSMLESYLRNGIYEIHRQKFSDTTSQKLKEIRGVTADWQENGFQHVIGKSGLYSTIILNEKVAVSELIERLKKRQVYVKSNLKSFYNAPLFNNSFRLSHTHLEFSEIECSYQIIYEELQKNNKEGENIKWLLVSE